jgi:hypothetical protein
MTWRELIAMIKGSIPDLDGKAQFCDARGNTHEINDYGIDMSEGDESGYYLE